MINSFCTGLVSAAFLAVSTSALALDKCDEARAAANGAIDSQYTPVYTELDTRIQQITAAGHDPTKFPYFDKDNKLQTVNLTTFKQDLKTQEAKDKNQANDKIKNECDKQLQPIQDVVNVAMTIATLGIANVLPKHMTNVDVSQIISGKPFGGDSALIPKMRDDALNALGIGGKNNDIGKVIRDPVRVVRCWFGC